MSRVNRPLRSSPSPRHLAASLFAGGLCLALAACASELEKTTSNPTLAARYDSAPLTIDPTKPVEVLGWWSNGRQLLQLSDDGAYRLWAGTNRFDAPLQTGRWSRLHYAAVELIPYGTRTPERTRCDLEPAGSEIRLLVPDLNPMVRFEQPPPAMEDRLVGTWRGAGGTLDLGPDGRYRATAPASESSGRPVALAGHGGRWLVDSGNLMLVPDSPSVSMVILAIEPVGLEDLRLRAGDGRYTRITSP
ncbi:MAG: hypothetical protein KF724_10245 [Phycisphaeraceae bacterium]|nr:hypothetical protein [Phycisphaeraceae bacterium]